MKEKIIYNILCTPDDNYVPYCGIMLTSLYSNNRDAEFNVFIICDSLNRKNISNLEYLSKKYGARITFININKEIFKNCPIRFGDHVSLAAYYRLLAPILIPQDVDKILYLDCDVIINDSIKELYDIDISKYALGAVIDEEFFNNEKYERLNYNKKFSYYNSGVLLLNLNYWRNNELSIKCLEYISKYPDRVIFHDQDTINAVLYKEIKSLPIKYNMQTGFLLTNYTRHYIEEINEIVEAANSPVIIHFTGASKPWQIGSKHPFRNRFLHYRNLSLWKNIKLIKNKSSIYARFIQIRNEIIWSLGIKKRPKSYIIDEQK